jgi:hypothetical protein
MLGTRFGIVELVTKIGHANGRNTMEQGLVQTIFATMRNECNG